MFDLLLGLLTNIFDFIYTLINGVVYPFIDRLIVTIFPVGDSIWFYANEVLTNFFFVGAQFVKMVFINLCGINGNVMSFVLGIFILRLGTYFALRLVRFGLNVYSLIRIGRTKG